MSIRDNAKQLASFGKAYKRDPRGLYYSQLYNVLELCEGVGKTTRKEVLEYVKRWYKGEINTKAEAFNERK